MKIIDLDYLENTALSTQLSNLSGYGWHDGYWTNQSGGKASTMPLEIIKCVKTDQLFRMPKKKSRVIDYLYRGWEYKMEILSRKEVIQISEKTMFFLLESVPPIRFGGKAFLVGEAMTHIDGRAIYACCFEVDNKHFLTFQSILDFDDNDYSDRYEKHLVNYDLF